MSKKKCSLRVYNGERWLYGNAAVLYDMSHNYEGYDDFVQSIAEMAGRHALEVATPIIVRDTLEKVTGPKLRKVK